MNCYWNFMNRTELKLKCFLVLNYDKKIWNLKVFQFVASIKFSLKCKLYENLFIHQRVVEATKIFDHDNLLRAEQKIRLRLDLRKLITNIHDSSNNFLESITSKMSVCQIHNWKCEHIHVGLAAIGNSLKIHRNVLLCNSTEFKWKRLNVNNLQLATSNSCFP